MFERPVHPKLKADAGIKVVEEVTPAFKNGVLIFVLRELIVDVIEADGFGIQMFCIQHPLVIGPVLDTVQME